MTFSSHPPDERWLVAGGEGGTLTDAFTVWCAGSWLAAEEEQHASISRQEVRERERVPTANLRIWRGSVLRFTGICARATLYTNAH